MKKIINILYIFIILLYLIMPQIMANDDMKEKAEVITNTENKTETKIENKTENNEDVKIIVAYNSHVQDLGWEKDFSKINGQESGSTGKNLKNEAIKIKLLEAPQNVKIEYQVYVKDKGWQEWKKDGEEAGTTGQNRIMEAIKIKLTGTEKYSVEYRTHLENYGWMEWKKDEEISGAVGKGLKMEAIQIRIVPKTETVLYQSHVQDIGWERYYNDGETSGIAGKKLKIEAIKIEVKDEEKNIDVKYQSHVQDIGWKKWKTNGEQSGTTGKNLKVEAIKIKIDDQYSDQYSITYRVYVQDDGWQSWKKDGEIAGTTGKNKRIEAIEIKLIKKEISSDFSVRYSAHVQDIGWQEYKNQSATAGTIGKSLKVEAIKIVGRNIPDGVKILYKSHVQDIGWEKNWKNAGEQSGTTGKNLKVEAIQIKLEGTEKYSITYRTYIQDKGWQDWANDGEISGTTGQNKRIEAIEIKIVPKIKNKTKMCIDTVIPNKIGQEEYKINGWLMTDVKDVQIQLLINDKKEKIKVERKERNDVLEAIKGYGGQESNPKPGFEVVADFSTYELGKINFKLQIVDKDEKVLVEQELEIEICEKIEREEGTYGETGLKVAKKQGGSDLKYYKYGKGENVFFAVFALHGYEDIWDKDGQELVNIANDFYNKLMSDKDYDIYEKWTIYVLPGINLDGLTNGWTNNGPGRTTLYSKAPNNKGIDMNRCWQIGDSYTKYTSDRNYNGTTGFQAYEAQALRDFLLKNKSQKGKTLLVDLHGWTQQLIGDVQMCSYYEKQFPENNKSGVGRYGTGYLVNWARTYLGSSAGAAKAALIELPKEGITGHQSVVEKNLSNRYITATLDMLKSI